MMVACAGEAALAAVVARRAARNTLAFPLALLSAVLFTWNFASVAYELSGNLGWHFLDVAVSPMTMPLALHVVLSFVGKRRALFGVLVATYVVFGAFGAVSFSALFFPWARGFAAGSTWVLWLILGAAPVAAFGFGLLGLHLRRASSPAERSRTQLLLAAVLVLALSQTDLWVDFGVDMPRLGSAGALLSNALMVVVALRFRILEENLSRLAGLYGLVLIGVGSFAYLVLFRYLTANLAMLVLSTVTLTLVVAAVGRRVAAPFLAQRERLDRFATLGRFSAQMAHDLKNPLAALKGAAQFLKEEKARGHSLDGRGEFIDLVLEQAERLERVIGNYQRLGRVAPERQPCAVNELVKSVLGLQTFASQGGVEVQTALAPNLPECLLDADLLSCALENLVRNAYEAMPRGGRLTVRTEAGTPERGGVTVLVEDTGEGMDARAQERAFDEFFTTKAEGSGLGLPFVRRVIDAHGGEVSLSSREGVGTRVSIALPER